MPGPDISEFVKSGTLRVHARPGKKKTAVTGFDSGRKALIVDVGAPAEGEKANVELVKFISRKLKRPVVMKSGFASKDKLLLVE